MIRLAWILVSTGLLLLSACMPAKGSSSLSGFNILTDDIELMAGDELWYVSRSWSPKTFSVELPRLPNFFDTFEGQTIRTSLSGFRAWQEELPENWDFKLYSVTGIQQIINADRIGDQADVTWDESVVATFALRIPVGTKACLYNGLVFIQKEINSQPLSIPIRIKVVDSSEKNSADTHCC
jgi:hypothetical protein